MKHVDWAGVGGITAGASAVCVAFTFMWRRLLRPVLNFLRDWHGSPARPGVDRQPGVMERLDAVEDDLAEVRGQLKPNGGTSFYDRVSTLAEVATQQAAPEIHIHPPKGTSS